MSEKETNTHENEDVDKKIEHEDIQNIDAEEKKTDDELQEIKDKYLRLFAEFDNYKKRTSKERIDLIQSASKDLIKDLLPIWDDFERAINSVQSEDTSSTDEAFKEGILLVYNKFVGILKQKGVEPFDKENKNFDPELHEAITEIPSPTDEMKGKIIDYVQNGYTLHGKVLRHAQVVTGK